LSLADDQLVSEQVVQAHELSLDELLQLAWEGGDLSALMHEGQLRLRNHIHKWRAIDQLEEVHETGSIPLVYAVEGGKRFGKTSAMLWIAHEIAVWFFKTYGRACMMRYTSAFQKTIDEIVGSVMPQCFRTAPDSCAPHYHGKRGVRPAGLYWPADGPTGGARLALSGLDRNPDGLRGQGNDFDFLSEAAFVDKLDYTIRNVLIHQYQQRPWARMIVETSAPEDIDTDWELIVLPDAKTRGAHFAATIDDNPRLTQREKDFFISMAGGMSSPNCLREYYNVIAGNPALKAFPEFDVTKHVREFERPEYAYGIVAADPGMTHLFGLVFAEYDFDHDKLLILDSWAQSNAGSMKVAAVCAAREFALWGRWPDTKMKRLPLFADRDSRGWVDLLEGDKHELLAKKMWEMAQTPVDQRPDFERYPGQWLMEPLPKHRAYWDRNGFHANPSVRVSDVDKQLIRDIDDHYGLTMEPTSKTELITMIRNTRNWLSEGRMWFHPDCGPVIDHFKAAKLDKRHRMLDEHKTYGHFDLAASGIYLTRRAELLLNLRPHPPSHLIQKFAPGAQVIDRLPWVAKPDHEVALERVQAIAHGQTQQKGRLRMFGGGKR